MLKSYEEVMDIFLEAFALTNSYRAAGELAGCSHHTIEHYVALQRAGELPARNERVSRPKLIDPYLDKIEEWVGRGAFAWQGPRGCCCRQVDGGRLCRVGSHGAPGGGGDEAAVSGGEAAGVSAVDHRAGDVGPMRNSA